MYKFQKDGREFVLNSNLPPREWQNVHYSGVGAPVEYWSRFSNTGGGEIFCVDQEGNKCQITSSGSKSLYLRDDDQNDLWSIAGFPVPSEVENYSCHYSLAETRISSSCKDIFASMSCFVPLGEAFEIWQLTLRNDSCDPRNLSVFPYMPMQLDGFKSKYEFGSWHKRVDYIDERNGLFASNVYPNPKPEMYTAMMLSSQAVVGCAGGNSELLEPSYSLAHPALVDGRDLSKHDTTHDEKGMCLMLQNKVSLQPGEETTLNFALGHAGTLQELSRVAELLSSDDKLGDLLNKVRAREEQLAETASIQTGVPEMDRFFNWWLKKQMTSYLVFKTGVRDNLQTIYSYAMVDYETSSQNFLKVLENQYEDGHFPHSTRPLNEKHYGDKASWLFLALPALIRESGDASFLEKQVSYILPVGKETDTTESVLEHLLKAYHYLSSGTGEHGLCLHHHADWNDDMDGPSRDGPGESVMVSMIFCRGLLDCAEMFEFSGHNNLAAEFRETYKTFKKNINTHAWDGEWYLRAFSGTGKKIGSKECKEGKIFLNTQAWALISEIADEAKTASILSNVDEKLELDIGLKLMHPTLSQFDPIIGSLSVALPGYYVNGVYNHGGSFMIMADIISGRGDVAWRRIQKILPDNEWNPSSQSTCEPFSITNCYRCDPLRYGLCGDVWHTGTSAWLYTAILEGIMGIRRDYQGLRITPCLPKELSRVQINRKFRGCSYQVDIENRSARMNSDIEVSVNGIAVSGNLIPHVPGRKACKITIVA